MEEAFLNYDRVKYHGHRIGDLVVSDNDRQEKLEIVGFSPTDNNRVIVKNHKGEEYPEVAENLTPIKKRKDGLIAYKLVSLKKDGSAGPMFINRSMRYKAGETYKAENHPTKGFAERPGFYCTSVPYAPHLSKHNRVWIKVEIFDYKTFKRPENQGGIWYIANEILVHGPLKDIYSEEFICRGSLIHDKMDMLIKNYASDIAEELTERDYKLKHEKDSSPWLEDQPNEYVYKEDAQDMFDEHYDILCDDFYRLVNRAIEINREESTY